MKIESATIAMFRSIQAATLETCGDFNVLVGKNNSGKSNVLSALNAFFECISDNTVVTLKPSIGQETDFFQGKFVDLKHAEPAEIAIIFVMTLAERDALVRDIVTEAPQMKNAVDGLDPSLRLSLIVSVVPPPNPYGFIRKISLVSTRASRDVQPERVLFDVSPDAAKELFVNLSQARTHLDEAEAYTNALPELRRFSSQLFGDKKDESRPPLRYLLEAIHSRSRSSVLRNLESLVAQSANVEELSVTINNLVTQKREDADTLLNQALKNKVTTFAGEQSAIPTYVKQLLSRVSSTNVLCLRERRKPIGREEAARLLSLKVTRGGPQVLRSIQETVSALLGVQIDAFESEPAGPRDTSQRRATEPNAEMDIDNFLADVNGSGIREALRIVLDCEFRQPDILLLEEPEIYLHPSLETSMMRYLKSRSESCQVFISTHSTNFLDRGEMKNVYLVAKDNSTHIQLLDYEDAESTIPRELGIRLSSLFMFDHIVFVEGPSDEAILRELASTLRVNFSQHNVGFVHMGGVRNFTHYAAKSTLAFLAKRNVKLLFIIDRDERDEGEVAKLQAIAGANAKVKVLDRRELENYLTSPSAISEFIALKRKLLGEKTASNLPSGSEILQTIDECAEKLKQHTIDKQTVRALCSPAYPDVKRLFGDGGDATIIERVVKEFERLIAQLEDSKGRAPTVYGEQSDRVGSAWSGKKLHLVPGAELLDMVCQAYGIRFKKEQDGPRLASLVSATEIPAEIQQILREIADV